VFVDEINLDDPPKEIKRKPVLFGPEQNI